MPFILYINYTVKKGGSKLEYKYEFDREKCWYKGVCKFYETEKCYHACNRYMQMDYLIKTSGLPAKLQYPTILKPSEVDYNAFVELQHIKNGLTEWVLGGNNLIIWSSECGNGKTTWASKLLLKWFDNSWAGNGWKTRGLFINVVEFMTKVKRAISDKEIKKETDKILDLLENVELVVWDDMGSDKITNYEFDLLYVAINTRLNNGKANIFTSNGTEAQFEENLGYRLKSRIWNNSQKILFKGTDMRGANFND